MPPAKQQEFLEKYLKLQSEIKQELAAMQKAQADPSAPEVTLSMRADIGKKLEIYRRLTTLIGQKKPLASTGVIPGPSSQPPPSGVTIPNTTSTDPNPSNPIPPTPDTAQPPLPSTTAAEPQNSNLTNPAVPSKESYPAEVAAQIHRLMQQQNKQNLAQQGIPSTAVTLLP